MRAQRPSCLWLTFLVIAVGAFATPGNAASQIPDKFENLRVLPKDIVRDSLVQIMRRFSFALEVRCQYCHAGGDGISFEGVNFASDEKATKRKARFMLGMVAELNGSTLAKLPERSNPPVRVECATCHRGLATPASLASTLMATIDAKGIDSAVKQYRDLRRETLPSGKYDFGVWSINELASTLTAQGKTAAAIAMLELNSEFNPASASIDLMLANLQLARGDTAKAIARYHLVLGKEPENQAARRRLDALTRKTP